MTKHEIVPSENPLAVMPIMDIDEALGRRQAIIEFTQKVMTPNVDYGKVPGTSKDTLLKPGAEKLTTLFGLSPQFHIMEKAEDWTGNEHDGEPFFYFQYKCQLYRGDLLVGEGLGSCNSWEKKYRYRKAARVCPRCNKDTIIKGKQEYGGGWLCWKKNGGCGAKFSDGDTEIESQEVGQIKNENPQDQVNTIDKMAQKRALVAATLIAVNASEFFTQDMEDLSDEIIDAEFTESNGEPTSKKSSSESQKEPARVENQWEREIIKAAKDLQLVDNDVHACTILNASPLMAVEYKKLATNIGIAYLIGYARVSEKHPDEKFDFKTETAINLWNENKKELIDLANEKLGG